MLRDSGSTSDSVKKVVSLDESKTSAQSVTSMVLSNKSKVYGFCGRGTSSRSYERRFGSGALTVGGHDHPRTCATMSLNPPSIHDGLHLPGHHLRDVLLCHEVATSWIEGSEGFRAVGIPKSYSNRNRSKRAQPQLRCSQYTDARPPRPQV